MATSNKYKRPDGTVVIKCDTCGHWRRHSDFLVGDKNPKDIECWDPKCAYCRKKDEPFSLDVREAVEMPEDAKWTDVVGDCHCGDGQYKSSNGRSGGVCFRCQGKAKLTWSDICRNYVFDLNEALRAMQRDEREIGGHERQDDRRAPMPMYDENLDEEELEDFDCQY